MIVVVVVVVIAAVTCCGQSYYRRRRCRPGDTALPEFGYVVLNYFQDHLCRGFYIILYHVMLYYVIPTRQMPLGAVRGLLRAYAAASLLFLWPSTSA